MAGLTVLVLGAYGLIGREITMALLRDGHHVRGLGRDRAQMFRQPGLAWVQADLADLTTAGAWASGLDGIDVVVNAAGALQDGARDRVAAVHRAAVAALAEAAPRAGVRRIVQISAVGAEPDAATPFMSTKAEGDAALRAAPVEHVILRPGLVLGRTVYGGSAMIRLLAAVPLVQPLALAETPIQVVAAEDVARAATLAVAGALPPGFEADLVADAPLPLGAIVSETRAWLGFAPARWQMPIPAVLMRLAGRVADGLGWLGWRAPLRTTALQELATGVTGDPGPWRQQTGAGFAGLEEILGAHPATLQDRWHGQLALLMPVLVLGLSVFWLASGLIGLWQIEAAGKVLRDAGSAPGLASLAVIGGSIADIALGLLVVLRRWARLACLGMVLISLSYLAFGTVLRPDLWADPLGPFVKILPGMLLALVTRVLLVSR